jgi:hypothetical protein
VTATGLPLLSPELALVDPELAAVARALLPPPGAFRPRFATLGAHDVPVPAGDAGAEPTPPAAAGRRRRPGRVAVALAAASSAVAAGALVAWTPRATEQPDGVPSATAALHRAAARDVRAARTYAWPSVPQATAYQVVLSRDGRAVYEALSDDADLDLPVGIRLEPGRYSWSATPVFADRPAGSSAKPVVEATFVVVPSPA